MTSREARGKEPPKSIVRRRELRERSTNPEQLLWEVLRNRRLAGFKFRRQYSIDRFIVDFVCLEAKLIVELDGDYHDYVIERDLARQRILESFGYRVARFWNEDVDEDLDAVVIAILRWLEATPNVPPQ